MDSHPSVQNVVCCVSSSSRLTLMSEGQRWNNDSQKKLSKDNAVMCAAKQRQRLWQQVVCHKTQFRSAMHWVDCLKLWQLTSHSCNPFLLSHHLKSSSQRKRNMSWGHAFLARHWCMKWNTADVSLGVILGGLCNDSAAGKWRFFCLKKPEIEQVSTMSCCQPVKVSSVLHGKEKFAPDKTLNWIQSTTTNNKCLFVTIPNWLKCCTKTDCFVINPLTFDTGKAKIHVRHVHHWTKCQMGANWLLNHLEFENFKLHVDTFS